MQSRILQLSFAVAMTTVVVFLAPSSELQAAEKPVLKITRGLRPDVSLPKSSTKDEPKCYSIGCPVQVGPTTGALFCSLRIHGRPVLWDYDAGTDVFVFDNLALVGAGGPTSLSRNENEKDSETGGSRCIVKYLALGGFWPLGAKRADGLAHPGNGKGFAFCQALSFVGLAETLERVFEQPSKQYLEVLQLSFDGQRVSVVHRDLIRSERLWSTADGWSIMAPGLQMAIPDGDDLLTALTAKKNGVGLNGVCRFRFADGQWRPIAFTPVDYPGSEPSMTRGGDGSLFFGMRPAKGKTEKDILVWRSKDGGTTWELILSAANVRPPTPVSVNATPDGTVFVAANVPIKHSEMEITTGLLSRPKLAVWPLTKEARLGPRQVIRDGPKEFGPPPSTCYWYVDHPMSAIIRLSDDRWHGILAYRIMMPLYGRKAEPIVPQTGCYVEEVSSAQPTTPPWRF